jgi:hypothetical protein
MAVRQPGLGLPAARWTEHLETGLAPALQRAGDFLTEHVSHATPILSLLICLGFALPATAHAWWQDDWHYRKQIAVDTTPQGAGINQALGRTALLVRLHTGNFTFDGVKEDGADLRFVVPMTRPCSITRSKV